MTRTVLLYGADEFIGRLVALQPAWQRPGAPKLVLAGRGAANLALLAEHLQLTARAFDWRDAAVLAAEIAKVDIVLNAATPFQDTVPALRTAALAQGRSYLDLNTELDVERMFEPLDKEAQQKGVAVVAGGGPSTVLTSLMADAAIAAVYAQGIIAGDRPIGTIRVAVSCVVDISRASAASVWRALSRDVAVALVAPSPLPSVPLIVQCGSRPIGQLERTFDFSLVANAKDQRICVGASLADLHAIAWSAVRLKHAVNAIEAYAASSKASRVGYPLGSTARAVLAPVYTFKVAERATALAFEGWPPGPVRPERRLEPFEIILQIEDELLKTVVDWRLKGPNMYDAAARLSAEMAVELARGAYVGLKTPGDLLVAPMTPAQPIAALDGVVLDRRVLP